MKCIINPGGTCFIHSGPFRRLCVYRGQPVLLAQPFSVGLIFGQMIDMSNWAKATEKTYLWSDLVHILLDRGSICSSDASKSSSIDNFLVGNMLNPFIVLIFPCAFHLLTNKVVMKILMHTFRYCDNENVHNKSFNGNKRSSFYSR